MDSGLKVIYKGIERNGTTGHVRYIGESDIEGVLLRRGLLYLYTCSCGFFHPKKLSCEHSFHYYMAKM